MSSLWTTPGPEVATADLPPSPAALPLLALLARLVADCVAVAAPAPPPPGAMPLAELAPEPLRLCWCWRDSGDELGSPEAAAATEGLEDPRSSGWSVLGAKMLEVLELFACRFR